VALREVSKNIPSLRGDVQDGLLEQLSLLLMHKPMPSKLAPPQPPELPAGPVLVPEMNTTVLALETLGQFQFQRHSLQMFLKYIAYVCCGGIEFAFISEHCLVSGIFEF
jgi:FKBP12-rapamycin complex-associated protein